jgi:hypothetical protein
LGYRFEAMSENKLYEETEDNFENEKKVSKCGTMQRGRSLSTRSTTGLTVSSPRTRSYAKPSNASTAFNSEF